MRRILPGLFALLFALSVPATALGLVTNWNLNGEYTIVFTCTSGCSGDYPHSMDVKFTNLGNGQVTGTGHYDVNPAITWMLTGTVSGTAVTLHVDYDASSYYVDLSGSIDTTDGSMSGSAASASQTFTWQTTAGAARLMPQSVGDCTPDSYAGFTYLWKGFVPAVGTGSSTPTVTTPFDLQPGLTYRIEASGSYFAGGNNLYDIEADAEYSQDQYQRDHDLAWTDSVHSYEGYGEGLLELKVNGGFAEWGAYSAGHRYTLDYSGLSGPMSFGFAIYDIYAQNNTGGLCVAVYATPYDFSGFFAPINNELMNGAKAGSAIPVKFSLGGDMGLGIFWPGYPKSYAIACDSAALSNDEMETVAAGGSTLTYDALPDQYAYVWKTDKAWKGTCRQLQVKLADGTLHTANFAFH
jgi:hypothetical protein